MFHDCNTQRVQYLCHSASSASSLAVVFVDKPIHIETYPKWNTQQLLYPHIDEPNQRVAERPGPLLVSLSKAN